MSEKQVDENQLQENQNEKAHYATEEIIDGVALKLNAREIIDNEKIKTAVIEIADVLENHGLNLAESAEVARLILLWAGFEIKANADKIKSEQTKSEPEQNE